MRLNHYQILGIPEDAELSQIKTAYRSLAKRCHPDTNHGSEAAAELFRQVNEAYRVLGDEQLRASYDHKLAAQRPPPPKPAPAKPSPSPQAGPRPDPQQKFNNFLYSVLGAILETPDEPTEISPLGRASPNGAAARKVPNKPDFNFYYYLAMERKKSPYSCGADGIYRRDKGAQNRPKHKTFTRGSGGGFVLILLAGLWELFKP